jgi:hypothetical protein
MDVQHLILRPLIAWMDWSLHDLRHTGAPLRQEERVQRDLRRRALDARRHLSYILTNECDYADLGADWFDRRTGNETHAQRLAHEMERVGYKVTIESAA